MAGESKCLEELIEAARPKTMTPEEAERQRRSFAYGNTNIENDLITRDTIDKAAERIESSGKTGR